MILNLSNVDLNFNHFNGASVSPSRLVYLACTDLFAYQYEKVFSFSVGGG